MGAFGYLLLTVGLVALLGVGYELYVTGWIAERAQRDRTSALESRWESPEPRVPAAAPASPEDRPVEGEGLVRLHVPALGPDFAVTVLEGVGDGTLAEGPGHYPGSAMPGRPGNFAVAGHRVTHGAPFADLDLLRSCQAVVVETATEWFVYRVLPMPAEIEGWATGRGTEPTCRGVAPLPPPYSELLGRTTVAPDRGTVIAPVPGGLWAAGTAPAPTERLITLTTCHPEFSARERLVVHGVLVAEYPKSGDRPAELAGG